MSTELSGIKKKIEKKSISDSIFKFLRDLNFVNHGFLDVRIFKGLYPNLSEEVLDKCISKKDTLNRNGIKLIENWNPNLFAFPIHVKVFPELFKFIVSSNEKYKVHFSAGKLLKWGLIKERNMPPSILKNSQQHKKYTITPEGLHVLKFFNDHKQLNLSDLKFLYFYKHTLDSQAGRYFQEKIDDYFNVMEKEMTKKEDGVNQNLQKIKLEESDDFLSFIEDDFSVIEIVRYKSKDNKEWNSKEEAEKRNQVLYILKTIEFQLVPSSISFVDSLLKKFDIIKKENKNEKSQNSKVRKSLL